MRVGCSEIEHESVQHALETLQAESRLRICEDYDDGIYHVFDVETDMTEFEVNEALENAGALVDFVED